MAQGGESFSFFKVESQNFRVTLQGNLFLMWLKHAKKKFPEFQYF